MDTRLRRAADIVIILSGAIFLTVLLAKYLLGAFIPLLFGALTASFIHPIVDMISKSSKISKKIISAFLVTLLYVSLATIAVYAASRLSSEVKNLIDSITKDPGAFDGIIDTVESNFKGIFEKSDFLLDIFRSDRLFDLNEIFLELLTALLSSVGSFLSSATINFATRIPEAILFVAVSFLSAYYFSCDRQQIISAIFSVIPEKVLPAITNTVRKATKALRGFLKAYCSVMILTFFELFIGFSILRVKYAFLLALAISVIDIMPILGTGTVIIPWAVFSLATGNKGLGIGLLILYALITVIRQLAEPKIVGDALGVHPLAALASTYVGIKLFGLSGVLIGPLIATAISVWKSSQQKKPQANSKASPTV